MTMTDICGSREGVGTGSTEYTILSPGIGLEYDVMALRKGQKTSLQIVARRDGRLSFWEIVPDRGQIIQMAEDSTVYRFDDLEAIEIDADGHTLRRMQGHLSINTEVKHRKQPTGFLVVWPHPDSTIAVPNPQEKPS